MTRLKSRGFFAVAWLIVAVLCVPVAPAITVRQANLAEIIASAGDIFSGVCIDRQMTFDEAIQRDVYVVTFKVNLMLKGEKQEVYTVTTSKTLVEMGQVPTYSVGDEVVLFLHTKSSLGFSSPVGLGQGKFSVIYDRQGTKKVVNANNNHNLFKGINTETIADKLSDNPRRESILKSLQQTSGAITYDRFITLVNVLMQ